MQKNLAAVNESRLDSSLKIIVKTSFIVFIGLIISKILGYAYRIIIARYFGPEVYGLFSLAVTIVSFFSTIAALGISEGLLRYVPLLRAKNKHREIKGLMSFALKLSLITGLIATLLLFFSADYISVYIFHDSSLSVLLKIFSFMAVISLVNNIFLNMLRGYEEISSYSFIYNIFHNIARLGILIILVILGFSSGADPVALSFVIGAFLTLILSYIFARIKLPQIFHDKVPERSSNNLKGEMLDYSWPVMFYGIMGLIFYWVDSFSLGFYKSAVEVGIYNTAVPIVMLIGVIPELFMQLFFPLINREYSMKNHKLIEQLSKQVTKWVFMASLPIFILIFFFPGAALNILFGAQYLSAQTALRLLLIGSFISALFVVSNNLISMIGKSKVILVNISVAAIVNFILNMFLVPMPSIFGLNNSDGLTGASLSTLASIILLNALFLIQTKKYLSFIPLRRKMITIALISLIPAALLFYLRNSMSMNIYSIILVSVLFLITYGVLLLISRSMDENDWMIIRAILKKLFKQSISKG
jgi:O-antigen/teichoic acid export membrane protein